MLSRKISERIFIGDDITVTLVDIRGDKVRLGITAPKEVAVHREEIYNILHNKNVDGQQKQESKDANAKR